MARSPLRIVLAFLLLGTTVSPVAAQDWWSPSFAFRARATVTTGPVAPDKGYLGYTARLFPLDTAALIAAGRLQPDCRDLRVVYWDGAANAEIARHLVDCGSATADLRFAIQTAQGPGAADAGYYLYYGDASAGPPPPVAPTSVYLWYDDGGANRTGAYDFGRLDAWHGAGWANSIVYNPAGYFTFDTGDNFTDSIRVAVDERDVYVEAEFFHEGCYNINMSSGVVARGIIASGAGGSEAADHYYATNRGQNAAGGCDMAGYAEDGDIIKSTRTGTVVDGPNPGGVVQNAWRRQGLAVWSVNPTNLSYYDDNLAANVGPLGYPAAGALHAAGSDPADFEGRGFAGLIIAQDRGRARNILVRRYVEPEPVVALGAVETQSVSVNAALSVATAADPVNGAIGPYDIPGSTQVFSLTSRNESAVALDADSVVLTISINPRTMLRVADFEAGVAGPVKFIDGSAQSGLTLDFVSLAAPGDDVSFSTDGVSFGYAPVPDANGADGAVTHLRVAPSGAFAAAASADPSFTIQYKTIVR